MGQGLQKALTTRIQNQKVFARKLEKLSKAIAPLQRREKRINVTTMRNLFRKKIGKIIQSHCSTPEEREKNKCDNHEKSFAKYYGSGASDYQNIIGGNQNAGTGSLLPSVSVPFFQQIPSNNLLGGGTNIIGGHQNAAGGGSQPIQQTSIG